MCTCFLPLHFQHFLTYFSSFVFLSVVGAWGLVLSRPWVRPGPYPPPLFNLFLYPLSFVLRSSSWPPPPPPPPTYVAIAV